MRGRKVTDFTSTDMFGLARSDRLRVVAHHELENSPLSQSSSRFSTGYSYQQQQLEGVLAKFLGTESALILSSRTQAAFTLLTALLSERDIVLADEQTQLPVQDVAHLVGAQCESFSSSLTTLEAALERNKGRQPIVVIEELSFRTGILVDPRYLQFLAERYRMRLVVDQSYSIGVSGPRGAGLVELLPIELAPLAVIGSFGHAIPGTGGFIGVSGNIYSDICQSSQVLTSEPPLPSYLLAMALSGLNSIELAIHERAVLTTRVRRLRQMIAGLPVVGGTDSYSPVVTLEVPTRSVAEAAVDRLFGRGFLIESAPIGRLRDGGAYLRFIVTTEHSERTLELLASAINEIVPPLLKKSA